MSSPNFYVPFGLHSLPLCPCNKFLGCAPDYFSIYWTWNFWLTFRFLIFFSLYFLFAFVEMNKIRNHGSIWSPKRKNGLCSKKHSIIPWKRWPTRSNLTIRRLSPKRSASKRTSRHKRTINSSLFSSVLFGSVFSLTKNIGNNYP